MTLKRFMVFLVTLASSLVIVLLVVIGLSGKPLTIDSGHVLVAMMVIAILAAVMGLARSFRIALLTSLVAAIGLWVGVYVLEYHGLVEYSGVMAVFLGALFGRRKLTIAIAFFVVAICLWFASGSLASLIAFAFFLGMIVLEAHVARASPFLTHPLRRLGRYGDPLRAFLSLFFAVVLLFALTYRLIDVLTPDHAFRLVPTPDREPTLFHFIYLSLFTLIGNPPGDIHPLIDLARVTLGLQRIFGVCLLGYYLKVLIDTSVELKAK